MSTTFENIRKKFQDNPNHFISNNFHEFSDIASEIDDYGTNTIGTKDETYIRDFVALVQTASLAYVTLDKGMSTILKVVALIQDPDMQDFIHVLIKLTVGLSVMEEIR